MGINVGTCVGQEEGCLEELVLRYVEGATFGLPVE